MGDAGSDARSDPCCDSSTEEPAFCEAASEPASVSDECASTITYCEQSALLEIEDAPGYGRGVALVDIDGDGWLDIWRSESGSPVDGHVLQSGAYRNQGDGTFERWDLGIADEDLAMNWAGVFGDIDNDGDPDLFLMNGGYEGEQPAALYRNDLEETGSFTEITEEAGIDTRPVWWWGGAFADFDLDGDLDLAAFGRSGSVTNTLQLYRNDGTGSFEEVSDELGLPDPGGDVKNPVWIDYDRDGDPDLLVTRHSPSISWDDEVGLFENRGSDGFVRVDPTDFPGEPVLSEEEFTFAAAAADFNQDGWQDIYLGRWGLQDYIALNQGDGTFELVGPEVGLEVPDGHNTMGLGIGDFTGDGFPDVLIGPGNPREAFPPVAFCSLGDELGFERCDEDFLAGVGETRWHGAAVGDLDGDMVPDVVWNLGGFHSYDQSEDADTRDELAVFINHDDPGQAVASVHVKGTESPVMAYGAQLRLEGDEPWYKVIHGAQGFQSRNSLDVLVPLGSADVEGLTVTWPSGRTEQFAVHARTNCELVEGTGTVVTGG